MKQLFAPGSSFRIFGVSSFVTLASVLAMLFFGGFDAMIVTLILIAIEIAFSFDNAIINAKTVAKLSPYWQKMFLTVGMIIAVLGMRVVFPILIVSLSASLSWAQVIDLALHHPQEYAHKLELAHPAIAAFGGAFLLMLALEFFIDDHREVVWLKWIERPLQKIANAWIPGLISIITVILLSVLPGNHHAKTTCIAGLFGIATHVLVGLVTKLAGSSQQNKAVSKTGLTGAAALTTFLYLEILDASFSFDGVIGAFAVTSKVILIAVGLGIGALWVRSLTVFMVHKGTLNNYIYLEHGAHYTVLMLAVILLTSVFFAVPDIVAGAAGLLFISSSILASKRALQAKAKH